ncbi:MAG: polysaccharide lyase family 1 protein [Bacteroidales bacterium]|nr:polysaccharide lyase family 1 protein [Bacteroidales bacterium]
MKKTILTAALSLIICASMSAQAPTGFVTFPDMGLNGVTGGMAGEVVRVTNRADFEKYVGDDVPRTVILDADLAGAGIYDKSDRINIGSNKTIIGSGAGRQINGICLEADRKENIIIRNLSIGLGKPDGLAFRTCHHVWVDHCDLYTCDDGLLDFTIASNYLTASWNTIHDHNKVTLVNSGTGHFEDHDRERATYHHNYFFNNEQRNPRVGYGLAHVYNNVYYNIHQYCIGYHSQAKVLSENNYFGEKAPSPFNQMYWIEPWTYAYADCEERGSYFTTPLENNPKKQPTGVSFDVAQFYDYGFSLDEAVSLPMQIKYMGPQPNLEYSTILFPGNGAIDIPVGTALAWGKHDRLRGVKVYFGTDPANLELQESGNVALEPGTTYYWKVEAEYAAVSPDAPGFIDKSDVHCFTTAPLQAQRPLPADGETDARMRRHLDRASASVNEALQWHQAFDAVSYKVYLGEKSGKLKAIGSTSECRIDPGALKQGKTYYWRVDAVKADGQVVKGAEWSFSTKAVALKEGRNECEDMARSGYIFEERQPIYSNGAAAICDEDGAGSIIGIWGGKGGRYDLSLTYTDESDGQGIFVLYVNGKEIATITGDINDDKLHTVSFGPKVSLKAGDEIRIESHTVRKMGNRIDCLDIVKAK